MTKKGLEDEIQYLREKLTACEKRIRELEDLGNLDDIRETDLAKVIMKKAAILSTTIDPFYRKIIREDIEVLKSILRGHE